MLLELVKTIVLKYMPAVRFVADSSTPTPITCALAGGIAPATFDTFSQTDVTDNPQPAVLVPTFVKVKLPALGTNAPPAGPTATNPVLGEIRKSSGKSYASCTPVVVRLAGALALKPIPRFAKAAHNAIWLVPPVSTRSA